MYIQETHRHRFQRQSEKKRCICHPKLGEAGRGLKFQRKREIIHRNMKE